MRGAFRRVGTAGAVLCALLIGAPAASAAPPNDNWANRQVIPALPFTDVEADVAGATLETTDPVVICRAALVGQGGNTLWYSYTTGPAVEYVTLSTVLSDYDTSVSVYEGTPGSFRMVHGGCNDDGAVLTDFQSRVTGVRLTPNTTYSIVVAQIDPLPDVVTLNLNVAPAVTYAVNKTADTGDGTCDADCSLREAVTAANATPGAVLIPAGNYTLSGAANDNNNASGDLDITTGMAIYGAGAGQTFIDAANVDRVLHADPLNTSRAALTLGDVTLRDGQVTGEGGGLLATGIGDFTDIHSVVIDSAIASTNGGGIRMTGRGRIVRSVVSANRAGLAGGGINAAGNSSSVVEIRDSTIESNMSLGTATNGGGGLHSTAFTEVVNSTIHGNTANFHGGGAHFTFTGSPALRSVTVSGNTSDNDGNATGAGGGDPARRLGTNFDSQHRPGRQPRARRAGLLEGRHRGARDRTQPPGGHRGGVRVHWTGRRHGERSGAGAAGGQRRADADAADRSGQPAGGRRRSERLRRPAGAPAGLRPAGQRLPAQPGRKR